MIFLSRDISILILPNNPSYYFLNLVEFTKALLTFHFNKLKILSKNKKMLDLSDLSICYRNYMGVSCFFTKSNKVIEIGVI